MLASSKPLPSAACQQQLPKPGHIQVLSNCGTPNIIQIPPEEAQDAQLSAADLHRLAGEEAVKAAAEAPRQRPGSPVPTTGVAFLLAGAGNIPGGSTLVGCSVLPCTRQQTCTMTPTSADHGHVTLANTCFSPAK